MISIPVWLMVLLAIAVVWIVVFILCATSKDTGSGIFPPIDPFLYFFGGIIATLLIVCGWGWFR